MTTTRPQGRRLSARQWAAVAAIVAGVAAMSAIVGRYVWEQREASPERLTAALAPLSPAERQDASQLLRGIRGPIHNGDIAWAISGAQAQTSPKAIRARQERAIEAATRGPA